MKRCLLMACVFMALSLSAQTYPEGTTWTEIRLDTLKYDRWFSEDGQPNYEIREFHVEGQTEINGKMFHNVYIKREDAPDSLAFYVKDGVNTMAAIDWLGSEFPFVGPYPFYQFEWETYSYPTIKSLIDDIFWGFDYGARFSAVEEKEGYFGGVSPLTYSNLRVRVWRYETPERYEYDVCMIKGIGVTSWLGPDCIFGPLDASEVYDFYYRKENSPDHPYRSMLVHFERGGEVLYDMWPTPEVTNSLSPSPSPIGRGDIYDFLGRKVSLSSNPSSMGRGNNGEENHNGTKLPKGVYIVNGKKYIYR